MHFCLQLNACEEHDLPHTAMGTSTRLPHEGSAGPQGRDLAERERLHQLRPKRGGRIAALGAEHGRIQEHIQRMHDELRDCGLRTKS